MKIIRQKNVNWEWVSFEDDMSEQELLEYKKSLIPQELSPRQICCWSQPGIATPGNGQVVIVAVVLFT